MATEQRHLVRVTDTELKILGARESTLTVVLPPAEVKQLGYRIEELYGMISTLATQLPLLKGYITTDAAVARDALDDLVAMIYQFLSDPNFNKKVTEQYEQQLRDYLQLKQKHKPQAEPSRDPPSDPKRSDGVIHVDFSKRRSDSSDSQ